jgi:hypothetical protein
MKDTKTGSRPAFTTFNLLGTLIDAALAGLMFLLFFLFVIPEHVPVYDPVWKAVWSAYTSVVMAGFWFLFLSLFRMTIVDQLRRKPAGNKWVNKAAHVFRYR